MLVEMKKNKMTCVLEKERKDFVTWKSIPLGDLLSSFPHMTYGIRKGG